MIATKIMFMIKIKHLGAMGFEQFILLINVARSTLLSVCNGEYLARPYAMKGRGLFRLFGSFEATNDPSHLQENISS